jgi:hypothetical protein
MKSTYTQKYITTLCSSSCLIFRRDVDPYPIFCGCLLFLPSMRGAEKNGLLVCIWSDDIGMPCLPRPCNAYPLRQSADMSHRRFCCFRICLCMCRSLLSVIGRHASLAFSSSSVCFSLDTKSLAQTSSCDSETTIYKSILTEK